jgi:hypothetical protein
LRPLLTIRSRGDTVPVRLISNAMTTKIVLSDFKLPIFLIVAITTVLLSFTKTGKAIALGGKITKTLSESTPPRAGKPNSKISIHLLSSGSFSGNAVGIEILRTSKASLSRKLIALDSDELQAILKLLKEAEK